MLLLSNSVGEKCVNAAMDVKALHRKLMEIGKIPCYVNNGILDEKILKGIVEVQRHFMLRPDKVVTANGLTHRFLSSWKKKPVNAGVQLPGRLKEAWDWLNPLLPHDSICMSGYRDIEEQRQILHKFFLKKYKTEIISKYGQIEFDAIQVDLLTNEDKVLEMVRGVGQAIAKPGRSAHQKGKAIDLGGAYDDKQVEIVKLVAKAHPDLFSGKVIKERNGCVHFEII